MWGGRWEGGTFGELEGEMAEELEPEEKLRLILKTRCKDEHAVWFTGQSVGENGESSNMKLKLVICQGHVRSQNKSCLKTAFGVGAV